MARGFAYAYKQGQRPADEPAGNYKTLNPESHSAGSSKRIHRVNPIPPHKPSVAAPPVCTATTKSGAACRAKPVSGTDCCVFHAA
jgi:hypothetical protein